MTERKQRAPRRTETTEAKDESWKILVVVCSCCCQCCWVLGFVAVGFCRCCCGGGGFWLLISLLLHPLSLPPPEAAIVCRMSRSSAAEESSSFSSVKPKRPVSAPSARLQRTESLSTKGEEDGEQDASTQAVIAQLKQEWAHKGDGEPNRFVYLNFKAPGEREVVADLRVRNTCPNPESRLAIIHNQPAVTCRIRCRRVGRRHLAMSPRCSEVSKAGRCGNINCAVPGYITPAEGSNLSGTKQQSLGARSNNVQPTPQHCPAVRNGNIRLHTASISSCTMQRPSAAYNNHP